MQYLSSSEMLEDSVLEQNMDSTTGGLHCAMRVPKESLLTLVRQLLQHEYAHTCY